MSQVRNSQIRFTLRIFQRRGLQDVPSAPITSLHRLKQEQKSRDKLQISTFIFHRASLALIQLNSIYGGMFPFSIYFSNAPRKLKLHKSYRPTASWSIDKCLFPAFCSAGFFIRFTSSRPSYGTLIKYWRRNVPVGLEISQFQWEKKRNHNHKD